MTNDPLFQLDAAAQRVKGRDHTMIDPVEFGEIKGAVAALQAQVTDFKVRQAQMGQKLDMVLDKLAEAKGGWLLRDGRAVSRTTYAALYAVIGLTFGFGDGAIDISLQEFNP